MKTRAFRRAAALLCLWAAPVMAQPWVDAEQGAALIRQERFPEGAAHYKAMIDRNPFDCFAWSQYGYCLHSDKQYEEALKAFGRAIELGVNRPGNLYNSACSYALLGKKDEALSTLQKALEARFAEQQTLENDTDMDSLRAEPRFAELTGITKGLQEDPATTRAAGWAWDLDFYARRMKQMHWNLFAKVPRDVFLGQVESLKHDAASLTDSQVRARLRRITAMVGDGHTASRLYAEGEPRRALPVQMFAFKDGLYIIGADEGHESLIGAKVVGVGGLTAEDAMKAVRPYASVDNEMGYLANGPMLLASPPILQAIGAAPDETGADLRLSRGSGEPEKVHLEPKSYPANGHAGVWTEGFTYVHDRLKGEKPLYLRDPQKVLRMEHVPEHKLVYFWFGAIADADDVTLKEFSERMFAFIREHGVENLVIDMRFNGGGNTGLIKPLVQGLIKSDVNRRGHLWVIIGRNTFSAAQNTVNFIEQNTEATFVGEPTGSRPEFVGESTWFVLPHSKTRVFCSSRYWQQMDSTDERVWVQPRVAAEPTFADYAAGRDAAMEAVMKWVGK